MAEDTNDSADQRLYRVNRFVVPNAAREEFLKLFKMTTDVLRAQPGFIQDFVLEQPGASSEFNFVSVIIFENESVTENVTAALSEMLQRNNINPLEIRQRLGIQADQANYKSLMM